MIKYCLSCRNISWDHCLLTESCHLCKPVLISVDILFCIKLYARMNWLIHSVIADPNRDLQSVGAQQRPFQDLEQDTATMLTSLSASLDYDDIV